MPSSKVRGFLLEWKNGEKGTERDESGKRTRSDEPRKTKERTGGKKRREMERKGEKGSQEVGVPSDLTNQTAASLTVHSVAWLTSVTRPLLLRPKKARPTSRENWCAY